MIHWTEEELQAMREWDARVENGGRNKEAQRRYYEKNKEKCRARRREYYYKNREKILEGRRKQPVKEEIE